MPHARNNGTNIYWTEEGSGEPVLLIMGLGYPLEMWHRTVPVLAPHFRVISFDNRGVGKSDVPPGPYTMATMAADAAAVLDAAGVESAHVVGMSMGGMIAQEFVLQNHSRVRKLVLGCTACGGPLAVRGEPEVTAVLMNRGSMGMDEAIEAAIPFIYHPETPRSRIDEDLAIRRRIFPSGEAYNSQLQAILSWQCYDRLGTVTAPTLVIHGDSDRLVVTANGELIARTIPGAKWVLLSKASHVFMTDQPVTSHAAILEFLQS